MNKISTGYRPRPLQAGIHRRLQRFSVLVCHRRFGKTVLCVNELIDHAVRSTRQRPRFAYIAPLYRQAKQVAWDYLKHYTDAIPDRKVNETELRVDLPNGARIQLYGADNPDSLRGIYLDGVVLDEYAQMSPHLWGEVIRPALADRKGWAVFIGTPQGHNEFWRKYRAACADEGWYAALFAASETGILPEAELDAARRDMTPEQYEQEFECSFEAAIRGAYYGKAMAEAQRTGRIRAVAHDPALPVDTAWDLGVGDPTAIWFVQLAGPEIHLLDYYEAAGEGLDHYARMLQSRAAKRGYVYGSHYAPHDALAREIGTGRTREEQARRLGLRLTVVPRHGIEDGINAVRSILPRCWFDADRAEPGIECLRQYRATGRRRHRHARRHGRCTTSTATGRTPSATSRWATATRLSGTGWRAWPTAGGTVRAAPGTITCGRATWSRSATTSSVLRYAASPLLRMRGAGNDRKRPPHPE